MAGSGKRKPRRERIIIFDTTLRDGEQSPGASLNIAEKLEIARQLEKLGVDVIEAGFPIASPGDFEAVREVSKLITRCAVCGLARCVDKDIDAAIEALAPAKKPRVHVFLATSKIHMQYKLHMARSKILELAVKGIKRAKAAVDDVEFSPEDASRTDRAFLAEVVTAAIDAGATTVNIPDTVGYAVPWEFAEVIEYLFANVPNISDAVISVHCHNDLGLAVANSLAAVRAGARQVECTINGIGERAGNASLEETVMGLKTRADFYPFTTGIKTKLLYPTSRMVSNLTGLTVQRNKAIVGQNAFAHEAGIHVHGMQQNAGTYEIMNPKDVGIGESTIVLGKHTGKHGYSRRIERMGYTVNDEQLDAIVTRCKKLADVKKEILDEDLEAIVEEVIGAAPDLWTLDVLHFSGGSGTIPTATVKMTDVNGKTYRDAATGDGPVDAIYTAFRRITGVELKLEDFTLRALPGGQDAQGEVTITVRHGDVVMHARGVSTDIVEASAKALLRVINRILAEPPKRKKAVSKRRK